MNYIGARTPQFPVPSSPGTTTKGEIAGWTWTLLLLLGVIALFLGIYTVFLNQVGYDRNLAQDAKDLSLIQQIEDLGVKDMQLMQEDMNLMLNISILDQRLIQERMERMLKDSILDMNLTDLQNQIFQDRDDRIAKDMILMDNVTYIQMMIDMFIEFDMNATEAFMQQCGNLTELNMLLDEEISNRMDKDMILMSNMTTIQDGIDMLRTDFLSIQTTINPLLDNIDDQLQALMDKDMILMANVTDLQTQINIEIGLRITADQVHDIRLDNIEAKHMVLMDDIATLKGQINSLFATLGMGIQTINTEPGSMKNFDILGSTNDFGNRITITPTVNGIDLTFDFFTGLEPRVVYTYFAGSNAAPSGGEMAAFFAYQSYPPSGITSLFDPIEHLGNGRCETYFSPRPCATSVMTRCDESGAACTDENPTWRTGAIKLEGQGGFDVDITANLGFHQDSGGDQTALFFLLEGDKTGSPSGSTFSLSPCRADVYPSDNQPRTACQYTDRGTWTEGNEYSGPVVSNGGPGQQDSVFHAGNYYLAIVTHFAVAASEPGTILGGFFWSLSGPTNPSGVSPVLPDANEVLSTTSPCVSEDYEDERPYTLSCRIFVWHDDPGDRTWIGTAIQGYDNVEGASYAGGPIRLSYLEFRVQAVKIF